MELKDVLLKRRSVRKYTDEVVSDEMINELLHAAMSGPSACNKRPWDFYVVKNPQTLKNVINSVNYACYGANCAIVVVGTLTRALPLKLGEFWIQDASAATENILLRATDLGLGTCWCGVYPQKFAVKRLQNALGLKLTQIPLNIILVGHPAEEPEARDQYEEKRVHFIE